MIWLSILRHVRKNMSNTASGVTVISVQDASNASLVNLSSAILDLNHVLRRRSIENVRWYSTGKVVRTLSSEIKRYVTNWRFFFTLRSEAIEVAVLLTF